MDHRAGSEDAIAAILLALWQRGFQAGDFKFEDTGLKPENVPYYDVSFQWLIDEGLVRLANKQRFWSDSMWAKDPVLTAKGIAVLNKPSPLPEQSIAQRLKSVLQDAGQTGYRAAVAEIVGLTAEHASTYFDRSGSHDH